MHHYENGKIVKENNMAIVNIKKCVDIRVKKCRSIMARQGLIGLIVTDPAEVTYLTGFQGEDSVLVLTARGRVLVTDSRFTVQVRQECPGLSMKLRKGSMQEAVADVFNSKTLSNANSAGKSSDKKNDRVVVGIEAAAVTMKEYKLYQKALGKSIKLKDGAGIVGKLRQCKDDYELRQIKKAIRIAEESMLDLLEWLKPGVKEVEAAAKLEYEMTRRGGGGPVGFPSIVAWGGHAAQCHAIPGNSRLRKGQSFLIDWGANVNGYRSDLTRSFVGGKIPKAFEYAYNLVLESQLAAIAAIRPGVCLSEVDKAARGVFPAGQSYYDHGTGHGIGLNIHEKPFLGPKATDVLEEGMVITVEPGIYIAGKFGIRIEDDVLVTTRGARVLSRLRKDIGFVRRDY